MKLNDSQRAALDTSSEVPVATASKTMLESALDYAREGWHVFPLVPGKKNPMFPKAHKNDGVIGCKGECGKTGHGAHDGTTDEATIRRWWGKYPNAGIGANLGDDRIAFDLDFNHDATALESFPETRTHWSGRDNGNRHLIYRYEPDSMAALVKQGADVLGKGIDVRTGFGGYIVMPPTLHEDTRKPYRVGPENGGVEHVLTDDELEAIQTEAGVQVSVRARAASKGFSVVQGGKKATSAPAMAGRATTLLSDLLANPPAEGGRNDWLAKVSGHYAKMHRDKEDLYRVHVAQANMLLAEPLDEAEFEKTTNSIWETETAEHPERNATESSGWLVGTGARLLCQIIEKEGDTSVPGLGSWGDFDIRALGVAVDDDSRRTYWVEIDSRDGVIATTLEGETLGDDRSIRRWLAAFGATVDTPFNAYPKTALGVRLQRYLEHQDPVRVHIADTLGWHPELEAFVTHDGVITADGFKTKEEVGLVADPNLIKRDVAPFAYGFEKDAKEAQRVLREVLTFQDEDTTSMFGSWWAACLLKPQLQEQTSIFPFFGVEAASESGKTNGFFAMMVGLNGNTRGQVAPTRPVLRDSASANRNGIVWADDLDDLQAYGEILRASTSNGTASKMDIDRNGIKNTRIVSPILVTGEHLGMSTQKALADRCVVVNAPSPTDRMSLHDPSRTQWEDIKALMRQYPREKGGLAVLAGHYQRAALQHEAKVGEVLRGFQKKAKGRHGDKMAVLVAGAHLLDALVGNDGAWEGQGEHARRVLAWATSKDNADRLQHDNTLTMEVIPWAIQQFGEQANPVRPEMGRFQGVPTPVLVRSAKDTDLFNEDDTPEVWVSASHLSMAWARDHNHRVESRVATPRAMQEQANRVCVAGSSKVVAHASSDEKSRYRQLLPAYAKIVLERARQD